MLKSSSSPVRFELFYKTPAELQSLAFFLKTQQTTRVNITNKNKEDDTLSTVRVLAKEFGASTGLGDICPHYSIKYNPVGGRPKDPTLDAAREFVQFCSDLRAAAKESGAPDAVSHVLLISGGGPKKRVNTVTLLQAIKKLRLSPSVPVYVAFNPFLPAPEDFEAEKERMREKLKTGLVAGIYLQTGTDTARLESGLQFLRSEIATHLQGVQGKGASTAAAAKEAEGRDESEGGTSGGAKRARVDPEASKPSTLPIYGSIFLPTPQLLAQMKFRPWNGVFLSERYLSSVENAEAISREVLRVYREFGVVPLVESRVQNATQMAHAERLLKPT